MKLDTTSEMSTVEEKFFYITRNLQEVLGKETLLTMLKEGKTPKIYWGTATTGRPHIAYLLPMIKLADFLRAGCEVTVLLADLHACLDAMKTPWELLDHRVRYYEAAIRGLLTAVGVPLEKLRFVRGSEYQLSREYTLDVYRLTSITTEHDAKKAGAEVVKQSDHPVVSSLLYPLLQALDEQYLGCDAQFGGVDQRKIFTFAEKHLPHMGYTKRIHLMNPMVPGLTGGKMSSSEEDSKIDLLDAPDLIRRKLKRAFCEPGNVTENGVLSFVRYVVCPLLFDRNEEFVIERNEENGGTLRLKDYDSIEKLFAEEKLHPGDLKESLVKYIERFLGPIRNKFDSDPELRRSLELAYPSKSDAPKPQVTNGPSLGTTDADFFNATLDLRVGKVVEIKPHPSADHLSVVLVEVAGAAQPRNAVVPNPLAKALAHGQFVAYVHNIKPSKFRGHPSEALILSAISNQPPEQGGETESLLLPDGVTVGDRVVALTDSEVDTYEKVMKANPNAPADLNPGGKAAEKEKWAKLASGVRVDSSGEAMYQDATLCTRVSGPIRVAKLRDISIKM